MEQGILRRSAVCAAALLTLLHATLHAAVTTATVSGAVTWNGKPLADAEALLIRPADRSDDERLGFEPGEKLAASGKTDGDGTFHFVLNDPKALYYVCVLKGDIGSFKTAIQINHPTTLTVHPIVTVRGQVRCTTESAVSQAVVATAGAGANYYPTFEAQPIPVSHTRSDAWRRREDCRDHRRPTGATGTADAEVGSRYARSLH
ncbi:hypothetical protein FJY63_11010 [Candidatus Sumerlaeota bacterium]|nr:hypothetical protein [Candidatus Sumerlaeota bacterium]